MGSIYDLSEHFGFMLQGLKYFMITIVYSERKLAHGIAKRTHDHVRHQLVSPYD